jgi:hypothetical protein
MRCLLSSAHNMAAMRFLVWIQREGIPRFETAVLDNAAGANVAST